MNKLNLIVKLDKFLKNKKFIKNDLINSIGNIYFHLSGKRKYQIKLVLLLNVITSFLESISVISIIPFLTALTNQEKLWEYNLFRKFFENLGFNKSDDLVLPAIFLFILFCVLAAITRIINLYVINRMTAAIGSELSVKAFRISLFQSYQTHLNTNSSSSISLIVYRINRTVQVLNSIFIAISSFAINLVLISMLLFLNSKLIICLVAIFLINYLFLSRLFKKKLYRNSKIIDFNSEKQLKIMQDSLGSIREIILNRNYKYFLESHKKFDLKIRRTIASNLFLGSFPRYYIESSGIIILTLISYFLYLESSNFETIILFIGPLALAIQKLLPAFQTLFKSWAFIQSNIESVDKLSENLNKEINSKELSYNNLPLNFEKKISFKKVFFKYESQKDYFIKNLSLDIYKGERIGITGKTGSGKTTFINLLMGLLRPSKGQILVDGEDIYSESKICNLTSWRQVISHVPQNIFLMDSTIIENIAFGYERNSIDYERVINASKSAAIYDFIKSLPEEFNTIVGERGVKLSGGQIQRIGIARALYNKTNILILDEATSALDNITEQIFMNTIYKIDRNITLFIIAHRESTLDRCDRCINFK